MSGNNENLRERPLSLEPVDPELHDRYRKEMEKMFTQEITGINKAGWWARDAVLLLLGTAFMTSALFNRPVALPTAGRWLWAISGVFTLGIALLELNIARKKKMDMRKDSKLMAGLIFGGLFGLANALLFVGLLGGNVKDLVFIAPIALLIIVMAVLIMVDYHVKQSELNIREKLLEMQLQLSELQKERNSKG